MSNLESLGPQDGNREDAAALALLPENEVSNPSNGPVKPGATLHTRNTAGSTTATTNISSSNSNTGNKGTWSPLKVPGSLGFRFTRGRAIPFVALLCIVFLLVMVTIHSSGYEADDPIPATVSDAQDTQRNRDRVGRVQSVQELRDFCHEHAPELQQASWVTQNKLVVEASGKSGRVEYDVESAPVCVDTRGRVLVDSVRYASPTSSFRRQDRLSVYALTDSDFTFGSDRGFALAIPAVGLLTKGLWIGTHIWHLVHDCLEALTFFFRSYNFEEMFHLPTQTVMLHGLRDEWTDRYGDTLKKAALSSRLLNAFSSPRYGGPFLSTSPSIVILPADTPRDHPSRQKLAAEPIMHCFCQAMSIHTQGMHDEIDPSIYHAIEDLANTQFGEQGYLQGHSLAQTEILRVNSHSWASKFWKGRPWGRDGKYRPRVLAINRKSRLIGNYEKYIDHLKQLDFRVEMVYPEDFTLDEQYHLGRYADMVIGMHGLGIAHGFWMDRFPLGCRAIVEFRPWVHPGLPVQLHRILGRFTGFNYTYPEPIDVTFGSSIANHTDARERLMSPKHIGGAWSFPEFTDQTAFYDEAKVMSLFEGLKEHLSRCLPLAEFSNRYSVVLSERKREL